MSIQDEPFQPGFLVPWWHVPLQQKLEELPEGVIMRKISPKEGGTLIDGIRVELSDGTSFELPEELAPNK